MRRVFEKEAQELAPQPGVSLKEVEDVAENRTSGFDLAFDRMKARRTGGAFIPKGEELPLRTLDVIDKGEWSRSTHDERFLPTASAATLAKAFAELDGSEAAIEAERKFQEEENERKRKEEEEIVRRELELQRLADEQLLAEEAERKRAENHSRQQEEEWEKEFLADDDPDREPTEEEAEHTARLARRLGAEFELPQSLLDDCRFPKDVEELVEFKKQFNEIDFDNSGQIDTYEMKLALGKLGMDLSEEQIRGLMSEGDKSSDAEVDFEEFIVLIKRFQSSQAERAHQTADRRGMSGFADAVKNMNIVRVETEFGTKVVVQRREVQAWENYMEFEDPIHWAAGKGDLLAMKQFINGLNNAPKIRPDRINKDGKMPIHYAAVWNKLTILQYLLDPPPLGAGMGIDPCDALYATPLMMAAEQGAGEAVSFLVKRRANICQQNVSGATALHSAAMLNFPDVVTRLLAAGCVVSGSDDQTIRLWPLFGEVSEEGVCESSELESNRVPHNFVGSLGSIYCLSVCQDRVATGHQDGTVKWSSVTTQQATPYHIKGLVGTRVFEGHTGHPNTVTALKLEKTSTTVPPHTMVTGSEDTTVRLWDMESAKCVRVYKDNRESNTPGAVIAVDFSKRADRVAAGTRAGSFLIWRLSDAELLQAAAAHTGSPVNSVQLDNNLLLTASSDRTVRLWNLEGKHSRTYVGHDSAVQSALRVEECVIRGKVIPETIVSGSAAGEIFFWDVLHKPGNQTAPRLALGSEVKEHVNAHRGPVYDMRLIYHLDKRLLIASSTPESGIGVWDYESEGGAVPIRRFRGHADDIRCVDWYGIDVNLGDPRGVTALMLAAERGLDAIISILLEILGINVWLGDREYCETALHRAAQHGHVSSMRLLLDFDPTLIYACTADNSTVLHRAVENDAGGPACVKVALEYGAEVNLLDSRGETAMHKAAGLGRYKALKVLATSPGIEVNAVGADFPIGGLPLVRPAQAPKEHRYPRLVKAPVQYITSGRRWTSVTPKAAGGALAKQAEVVKEYHLLRHSLGWTPLHQACAFGHSAAVKVLLDTKADPDFRDDLGRTPLHLACANGTPDQIRLLVSAGAKVNEREELGSTPLHYAVKTAQEGAVRTLVQMAEDELDVDAEEDTYGLTALHMAAKYGLEGMCFTLLEAGANPNAPDRRISTPLHHALEGAVLGPFDPTPPQLPNQVMKGAFMVESTRKARNWVQMWNEGLRSTKGFSQDRIEELKEEVKSQFGRFVDTTQVLLDGFSRYDLTDGSGKTALDYAKEDPALWETFKPMFANCSPDGKCYLVKGDMLTATYLGERGTKFEHPNKWQLVSNFQVRCLDGAPTMSGSRAFKKTSSRFAIQEVDFRSLGELQIGEAGHLSRKECTAYILSVDYVEEFSGLDKEAWSFLCNWDSTSRTFETKYNALAVGLRPHQDYSLRAVSVDEWEDAKHRAKNAQSPLQGQAARSPPQSRSPMQTGSPMQRHP